MNLRRVGGPVLAVLVGLTIYALWPREKLSPEDEIRALVARMVAAAERKEPAEVVAPLDEAFRGGGLSKPELKQLVVGQVFRAQTIVVLNPLLEVTVSSPTEGHFKGTFLLGRDGAAHEASRYEIEADVRKGEAGWQIVSASWAH